MHSYLSPCTRQVFVFSGPWCPSVQREGWWDGPEGPDQSELGWPKELTQNGSRAPLQTMCVWEGGMRCQRRAINREILLSYSLPHQVMQRSSVGTDENPIFDKVSLFLKNNWVKKNLKRRSRSQCDLRIKQRLYWAHPVLSGFIIWATVVSSLKQEKCWGFSFKRFPPPKKKSTSGHHCGVPRGARNSENPVTWAPDSAI